MLQNINAPDLRDHDKNEVEAEEMSEDDASICSSIIEDETTFHYPLEVEECDDELELSQFEISPNQTKKRFREDECDDAALLPLVKKPHTVLGLTGEDKEQSNEQEGEDSSRDGGESGDEGGKGGGKQQGGQTHQGEEGTRQHGGTGGESGCSEESQQQQELLLQQEREQQIGGQDEIKSKEEGKEKQHKGKFFYNVLDNYK